MHSIHYSKDHAHTAIGWQDRDTSTFLSDILQYLWTPCTFIRGVRNSETVRVISYLVLDVDNGIPLAEAIDILKEENLKHVIATTENHGIKGDRYRVILFPDGEVTPKTYRASLYILHKKLKSDPACLHPSAVYKPSKEIICNVDGELLPISVADTLTDRMSVEEISVIYQNNLRKLFTTNVGFTEGGRNNFLFLTAVSAKNLNIPADVFYETVRRFTDLSEKELQNIIKSAYKGGSHE